MHWGCCACRHADTCRHVDTVRADLRKQLQLWKILEVIPLNCETLLDLVPWQQNQVSPML